VPDPVIWTIAWRNIWRNKKRSGILLAAIAFGLWAGLLTTGMFNGMSVQMIRSAIDTRTAHIQIHAPGFVEHPEIANVIPDGAAVLDAVRATTGVAEAAGRAVVPSMASSAATGTGVALYGVDPRAEAAISSVPRKVVEGSYIDPGGRNTCVIGRGLADKLKLETGNKIVVQAQALDGTIAGGAFRIVGIFKTVSLEFDKTAVFALSGDVDRIFGLGGAIHEIAVRTDGLSDVDPLRDRLAARFPKLDVETWAQLEPEVNLLTSTTWQMSQVLMTLIMVALVFGITNTMLMGVLERTRELGVLISLGMRQGLVFGMIMIETVVLSGLGGLVGAALGASTVAVLGRVGLDLGIIATGLASAGVESTLYPRLTGSEYPFVAFLVLATALLGSLYPSIKASRLAPVQAMRVY
jgi:putative ABC transport system permease protein